jgi:hypothetical protein
MLGTLWMFNAPNYLAASPAPSNSRPRPGASAEPLMPVPHPSVDLPTDDLLPSDGPLTSNNGDSMVSAPSTTAATGR